MKTIKISALISVLLLSSCHNYLDENLQGTFSSATFYKSQDDALTAIAGVYNVTAFVNTMNQLWVFWRCCL